MKNARKYERTCERCEKEFVAAHPRARFCDENCRRRACAERHRHVCQRCGGLFGEGSAWSKRPKLFCGACVTVQAAQRELAIIEGYRAGKGPAEIAAELGTTTATVAVHAKELRRRGVDVPYAPYAQARMGGTVAA